MPDYTFLDRDTNNNYYRYQDYVSPYIAGSGDGIVTAGGSPAPKPIFIYEVKHAALGSIPPKYVCTQMSLQDGHFLFLDLDASKKYMLVCKDDAGNYQPVSWDLVSPATDKTRAELEELKQSWQS